MRGRCIEKMSTTFEVFPGSGDIPSFLELIENTEKELHQYLKSININKTIKLGVELLSNTDHCKKPFRLSDKMIWDDSVYAWFFAYHIPGGSDAYFYRHDDLEVKFLKEELEENPNFHRHRSCIAGNIHLGYRWVFRRSAGQHAVITLCYGFLAATLARMTKGVIYSDDGAWDYNKFPADPDDFIQWYFRLDTVDEESNVDIDFVKESLLSIRKTLYCKRKSIVAREMNKQIFEKYLDMALDELHKKHEGKLNDLVFSIVPVIKKDKCLTGTDDIMRLWGLNPKRVDKKLFTKQEVLLP